MGNAPIIDIAKLQERIAKKQQATQNRKLREQAKKYEFEQIDLLNQSLDYMERYPENEPINMPYIFCCGKAAVASEYFGNKEKDDTQLVFAKECAETVKIAYLQYVYEQGFPELETTAPKNYKDLFFEVSRSSLDILARQKNFDSYLLAREFNRDETKKFYMHHREVMIKNNLIRDCQDLIDFVIRKLIIEAPPGTGKSAIGEALVAFLTGLDATARCLIATAAGDLADGFYTDFKAFFQIEENNDYRHNAIFGTAKQYFTNAVSRRININSNAREPNLLITTVEKGATGIIHINKQGIVYMDDYISGYEQANNPEQLKKMNKQLDKAVYDRRENQQVRFLGIATPWSTFDYLAEKKIKWAGRKDFRLNSTPAYHIDDNGKKITNFPYRNKFYKSIAYWEEQMGIEGGGEPDPTNSAKYLMKYIDADGTPFNATLIKNYYTKLPEREPDRIIAFGDVATAIDGDDFAFPIGYVYEEEGDIYIHDCVNSNKGIDIVRPRIVDKIVKHKVNAAKFEVVSVGKSEIDKIAEQVRGKGHHSNIRDFQQKTTSSKRDRILAYETSIKGMATATGSYNLWFLDKSLRVDNVDYNNGMNVMFGWSDNIAKQKSQRDDWIDACAGLLSMVATSGKTRVNKKISQKDLGL